MDKLSNLYILRSFLVCVYFQISFKIFLAATIFHNFAAGINQRWREGRSSGGAHRHIVLVICFGATVLQSPHAGEGDTVSFSSLPLSRSRSLCPPFSLLLLFFPCQQKQARTQKEIWPKGACASVVVGGSGCTRKKNAQNYIISRTKHDRLLKLIKTIV